MSQHAPTVLLDDEGTELFEGINCTPDICRICGCTEFDPCVNFITGKPCSWFTPTFDLCDNPACVHEDLRRVLGIAA